MSQRRSLAVGLSKIEDADPRAVESFIKQEGAPAEHAVRRESTAVERLPIESKSAVEEAEIRRPLRRAKRSPVVPIGLIPVTVRLRPEVASALKRASLERELAGIELHTQQEIVEEALLPWLKTEGVLD